MTISDFQQWLNERGASFAVDGQAGPATRAAILSVFTNRNAPAITVTELSACARSIGISTKQLAAIAKVESGGGGFTDSGLPKILFERHYFWRLTQGRFGPSSFSNPKGGGYNEDSWQKLCMAACKDPEAAFSSASWGKFQVMGSHWSRLGYHSPLDMAHSMTRSEAAHYDALARYITSFGLVDEAKALSADPETNRAFARGYNGPAYERFAYHLKLARAMA